MVCFVAHRGDTLAQRALEVLKAQAFPVRSLEDPKGYLGPDEVVLFTFPEHPKMRFPSKWVRMINGSTKDTGGLPAWVLQTRRAIGVKSRPDASLGNPGFQAAIVNAACNLAGIHRPGLLPGNSVNKHIRGTYSGVYTYM